MSTARDARLSRRALLLGGMGLGLGAVAGCQREAPPGASPNLLLSSAPKISAEPVTTARNLSAGRYREVNVLIIRPAGIPVEPIPVCLALHPGGASGLASQFLELGLPEMLTALVQTGARPFAVMAVDGGNWMGSRNDEPQRMLAKDVPDWLAYHDLASTPFAVLGIGEGGYGALAHAQMPGFAAVAAISPRLYTNWNEARGGGMFESQEQWTDSDPLRHQASYGTLQVGLWAGTEEPHIEATREFAEKVKAKTAAFTPGKADAALWRRTLPEALKFVSGHVGKT